MRRCPKCKVEFQIVRKTFAEIDVCPQCGGVFLDAGEGVAIHGAEADASFLVKDGRAHLVRASELACPSSAHPATAMNVFAIGFGEQSIEFEHCGACHGVFLDHGEGAAMEAMERTEQEVTTATGARFSAPPATDRHAAAVDAVRAEKGRSFFEVFVTDFLRGAARAGAALADAEPHRRHRRHRR